jgi:hypothetical protein
MLRIAADGGILRCVLTRKTGSAPLNAAILSGLRRLAKVQPPPGATEGTFTVTLTLTHPADGSSGKVR